MLHYRSGEEIRKGDRVLFHGEPARIDFVADTPGNPDTNRFIQEYGGGVMVLDSVSVHTFIPTNQLPDYEDLEFVSRAGGIQ
jgi:hypothetical protein